MRELETAVLIRHLPDHGLEPGDIGTVVHCYPGGAAYEVEFMRANGSTVAVVTLEDADVRPAGPDEMVRVRPLHPA